MLKIKDYIDMDWIIQKYNLIMAGHCDEQGVYLFYNDYLYIDIKSREIHIERATNIEINILYDLITAGLVEKVKE